MRGVVYTATNKANGKVYVGATRQFLENRIGQHVEAADTISTKFYRALKEVGRDGFDWAVIAGAASRRALHNEERKWIAELGTVKNGYNTSPGDYLADIGVLERGKKRRKKKMILTAEPYKKHPNKRLIAMRLKNGDCTCYECLLKAANS